MATTGNQLQPNQTAKTLLQVLALLLASLLTTPANSEEAEKGAEIAAEIEAPDNWYQVEVILFTQNGNIGGEEPPQHYQLGFPENWLTLIDPNMPLEQDGFPLAQGSLLYSSNLEDAERIIPLAVVADPLTADEGPFTADSLIVDVTESIDATPVPEEIYVPQYEAPFLLLDKSVRGLNDSAAALNRRQYNVVFHEAWRFAADETAADPWLIIKAGQRLEDRFQLEGSLRFYKSRFLHFESDLWLLQFANVDEPVKLIDIPDFPVLPDVAEDEFRVDYLSTGLIPDLDLNSQEPLTDAFEERVLENPENALVQIQGPSFEGSSFQDSSLTAPPSQESVILGSETTLEDNLITPAPQLSDASANDTVIAQKYPVKTVWVLKQSKRIEEQTIYYIDHPEMGIMLTIKAFTPELLNPPEQALEPLTPEFTEDAFTQPLAQ